MVHGFPLIQLGYAEARIAALQTHAACMPPKEGEKNLKQPGYISAQLHQGISASPMFLDYDVFESVEAFAAITRQPEFGSLREAYPDSAAASMHLFRRVATPGICLGEAATQS